MFDPEQKGFVKFSELLLTFSMAMRGSGKKKKLKGMLHKIIFGCDLVSLL